MDQQLGSQFLDNNRKSKYGLIDCDVHPIPKSTEEIRSYLAEPWKDRYRGSSRGFFINPVHAMRLDATPPGGGPAGSDPTSCGNS